MKSKKLQKIAAKQARDVSPEINATFLEAALLGLTDKQDDERPYVNLRYYWPDHECFSSWGAEKLKAFSSFCRKLSQVKWQDIYRTAGAPGNKTGFGYTPHKDIKVLPKNPDIEKFSPDLTWFELRVDQESRVHGFRAKDAFFLVFLDGDHQIYRD
ncbi:MULTISPECIES: hypothetical protein [Bradyrhizobium]|uniref:hypothetical protein n=1 Tax=Bradyrhizobium TaxID=374 RepID=UPI000D72B989|nr:hypothetical protein [Bradyrhizobium diazoefficiens]AWO91945.1 hypothetical protein DI395_27885 [Bradyrhizobium diazoefficiens]